jgi:hypothetical protein
MICGLFNVIILKINHSLEKAKDIIDRQPQCPDKKRPMIEITGLAYL